MPGKSVLAAVVFLAIIGTLGGAAHADWPDKVFAPYCYIRKTGSSELTNCNAATGQKYFTMAFMNSQNGEPYWENIGPVTSRPYHEQIDAIRAKGGDVIMSFGGAKAGDDGTELATAERDPVKLQAKYQAIVDAYKLTWIDQDIEGGDIRDATINHNRNTALAGLQKANPGLIVAYTLGCSPTRGFGAQPLDILRDAKAKGLRIGVVNIMTMDYGGATDRRGETMGQLAIDAAKQAYAQCQTIDPDTKIGITPDIGQNDVAAEVYTIPDTQLDLKFAQETPWVRLIAFWEVGRDNGGVSPAGVAPSTRRPATFPAGLAVSGTGIPRAKPLEYIDTFKVFTVGFTPAKP